MNIIQVIIPITLLMSAVFGGVFGVFPQYETFMSVQEAIKERKERIQTGEEVLARLRETQRKIILREDDFAKLNAAVPNDTALPSVYHDLQRMGSESGLILLKLEFKTSPSVDNTSLAITNITLQLAGSYQGIKNFISQVKSSERMINTQSLGLEVQDREEEILELEVNVAVYAAQIL